ncbi:MAG: DnaJ domain-containing protein [Halobacteria archaeon]|nr:DnaJ domain-containing protein [Halobacteria archaeon]
MSIVLIFAVWAVVIVLIIAPMMILNGVSAVIRGHARRDVGHQGQQYTGGKGPGGVFGQRDPDDYRDKTQGDLRDKTAERVESFLDKHDFEYERDREFRAGSEDVTVGFYLPDSGIAIILDDWYKEYLVNKNLDVSTIIVELHSTENYQYETLRRALGVESDWRDDIGIDIEVEGGRFVEDTEVLGIEVDEVSHDELKSAYRERIKEVHPDLNESENAEEEFKRVKQAYENLKEEIEGEADAEADTD